LEIRKQGRIAILGVFSRWVVLRYHLPIFIALYRF